MKQASFIVAVACAWLIMALGCSSLPSQTAGGVPRYEIDPWWPKPLPEGWIAGRLGAVCMDAHDHVIVTNRRDITKEEEETSKQAPSVLIFDLAGNLVDSWDGDWNTLPGVIHGCFADRDNNIWLTGNGDGAIQKYTHDGKLLLQIGKRGVFDTSDGTIKGKRLNAGQTQFFNPAAVVVDPGNGDVYVADGYGNRRVAVFDRNGKFLQVFDKMGNFQKNIWIRTGTKDVPDPRGTAWWIDFSRDREQKFMYVMNGRNEQVHILDHASGKILSSFGRPGHQLANFTHGHTLAVDSKGNVYVAETDWGRRIQKFKPADGQ